jgi:hypothetical protein
MEMREGDSGKKGINGRYKGVKDKWKKCNDSCEISRLFPVSSFPMALRQVFGPWPARSPSSNLLSSVLAPSRLFSQVIK